MKVVYVLAMLALMGCAQASKAPTDSNERTPAQSANTKAEADEQFGTIKNRVICGVSCDTHSVGGHLGHDYAAIGKIFVAKPEDIKEQHFGACMEVAQTLPLMTARIADAKPGDMTQALCADILLGKLDKKRVDLSTMSPYPEMPKHVVRIRVRK